jgi:hypothetical protein
VREAKGLDFHSVCVLDAGRQLDRIVREAERFRSDSDIEELRKRLAIDQLRVALSRPTERLIWLDVSPTERVLDESLRFLNRKQIEGTAVASSVPAAVLKNLEEEELDLEERVQRCQADARQYLNVRPDMAWSRAQQAVTLLGPVEGPVAVTDPQARNTTYLSLAEICFTLGMRNLKLAPELGRVDLFSEAHLAAYNAQKSGLASILAAVGRAHRCPVASGDRLQTVVEMAEVFCAGKEQLEPWVLLEIGPKITAWMEEIEAGLFNGQNAAILLPVLRPFYETLGIPDRVERFARMKQRAIQLLMKDKQWAMALMLVRQEDQPKLEAQCHEGVGDFANAAACYRRAGDLKEALRCYRSVPDFDAALSLVRELKDHPAADTLEWLAKMRELVGQRPEKFGKTVTASEKKLLEELLERSLGVTRKKAAAKKAAAKKAATPRKAPAQRKRMPRIAKDEELF